MNVTVGESNADFMGNSNFVIQKAIDFVKANGGGSVKLLPGKYFLRNSVRLYSNIHLTGANEETVLFKEASATEPLIEDTDWYERRITIKNTSGFHNGDGIILRGRCPHSGRFILAKHTVASINGLDILLLDNTQRVDSDNFWVGYDAVASSVFSLITANDSSNISVSNLLVEGNRKNNDYLNGNYGGALFFQDCKGVRINNVEVRNMNSDALSFQTVHCLTVENSRFINAVQGIHPGSGSFKPRILNNHLAKCQTNGLAWCWGIKKGMAEGNLIEDCDIGISIGHRDTDNVIKKNIVRNCRRTGLLFREDPPAQAAHRNLIEDNVFENIGSLDRPAYGIDIDAPVDGIRLLNNHIFCDKRGLMKAGIRIGPSASNLKISNNKIENIEPKIEDLRKNMR